MRKNIFEKLMVFLDKLDQTRLSYSLTRQRDEALMVSVAVPGERWEIEFLRDGSIEVERFVSQGEIGGEESLEDLFARYADLDSLPENLDAELTSIAD